MAEILGRAGRTVFAALLLAVAITGLWCAALAAPAPQKKAARPPPSPSVVGTWSLSWQGGWGTCTLHRQGGWECDWFGQHWVGVWTVKDGVLTVEEAIPPDGAARIVWRVTLDGTGRAGPLSGGGTFALTSILGPKA
jgi:hypothetical protein